MDIEHFTKLCTYFSSLGATQIKIMGGEPTIHSNFIDLMTIAQNNFAVVSLFTNAISDSLYSFVPRKQDVITYNFKFRRFLNKEKLLLHYPGFRNLEIQITPSVIKEKLVDRILEIVSLAPDRIRPCLTLDCTANIFADRDMIVPIYEYVWDKCAEYGIMMGQDHLIPLCFLVGTKIPICKQGSICSLDCAGLIDSDYNLKFCNQIQDTLGTLFMPDGSLLSPDSFRRILTNRYMIQLDINKKRGCEHCRMFDVYCTGGCFVGKNVIPQKL